VALKGQTRDSNTLIAQISRKLLELETTNLVCSFVSGLSGGRTNNFPESGRGLDHVIRTIFGSKVGYPSDSLASCYDYRAMHFSAKRDLAIACCLSVCVSVRPSVCL